MLSVTVELADVTMQFSRNVLFKGINCSVQSGDCLEIAGKNGAGKSTLIKIIAGLIRPVSGRVQVCVNKKVVADDERCRWIGMVSPEVVMYNALTGVENIRFLTQARGLAVTDSEILECCELVGLNQWRHNLTKTYSTGMRQRLKLAALLAIKPPVWLLDEPASNLDADGRSMVAEVVRLALKRGVTIVIAVNEPWEATYAKCKIHLA